jgi:hypothetical protein
MAEGSRYTQSEDNNTRFSELVRNGERRLAETATEFPQLSFLGGVSLPPEVRPEHTTTPESTQ